MDDERKIDTDALEKAIVESKSLRPGADHYRAYVGPPAQYDFMGATQFNLLTGLGLREEHRLLDLGCGSLRAGKFLIQYLLPDRYFGVEPNSWLWQDALKNEIGDAIAPIKKPTFFAIDDFTLNDISTDSIDAAVAQSIYSHAGADVVLRSLKAVAKVLKPEGQFLFTALTETTPSFDNIKRGSSISGWTYPPCIGYPADEIVEMCDEAGLYAQKLDWYHPRQTWFRATHDKTQSLTSAMMEQLGTGRPLFDSRFE